MTENLEENLDYQSELTLDIKKVLKIVCLLSVVLYPIFLIGDFLFYPDLIHLFVFLRLTVVVTCVLILANLKNMSMLKSVELSAILTTTVCAQTITLMPILANDPSTPYYAGINLVGIGTITFIPWRLKRLPIAVSAVFLPYILSGIVLCLTVADKWSGFILNTLFVIGTMAISTTIRVHSTKIRHQEFLSRKKLAQEISERTEIIEARTKELLEVRSLSKQFSPQIVKAISSGQLTLNQKVHRTPICAIFIDIVNSTRRIVRIDNHDMNQVISRFMDNTISILLKHDLTVDKFLGDGILAFSNDPVKQADYAERTVLAAIEVISNIQENQNWFIERWLNKFEVRIGIASGYANVGFYGSEDLYRTYTAIGPVMNLASRLCAQGNPNEVLISNSVYKEVNNNPFLKFTQTENLILKGFEDDIIRAYSVTREVEKVGEAPPSCGTCGSQMVLKQNIKGIFDFKCSTCEMDEVLKLSS